MNLAANYRLNDNFSLYGRIENAFDTQYQSPDGFLRPGIGAYAGIKANFLNEAWDLRGRRSALLSRAGDGRARLSASCR